jgi:hypothetical protein
MKNETLSVLAAAAVGLGGMLGGCDVDKEECDELDKYHTSLYGPNIDGEKVSFTTHRILRTLPGSDYQARLEVCRDREDGEIICGPNTVVYRDFDCNGTVDQIDNNTEYLVSTRDWDIEGIEDSFKYTTEDLVGRAVLEEAQPKYDQYLDKILVANEISREEALMAKEQEIDTILENIGVVE